ncbi:MAG: hypothetical protein KGY51_11615 [Psychroflexus sp.]|nr:hypothetical protein [Psychroflexus sp.]
MINKKLFLAVDGLFEGQIKVDSSFYDGNYYLKAETKYMKNFKEDYAHVQQFEIIGEGQLNKNQELKSYDFQTLPESGHSVINTTSHLGLKLINGNGLGITFKAELFEDDKPVIDFKSNRFGHAKVEFSPKEGKNYYIKATLPNGDIIEKTVEDIKPFGYVMNVNNTLANNTLVEISSNLPKEYDHDNTDVKLMVHQEGKHFNVPVYLDSEMTSIPLLFNQRQLFHGVNTLTLMVNNQPVAERLIFNESKTKNSSKDIVVNSFKYSKNDSIQLQLALADLNTDANLSISILPEKTISYVKNQNISTAFLLEPFVNGYIEDKTYYFTETDAKTKYNLDLLLLTQGWSQYNWDNIFSDAPSLKYQRQSGITQKIQINERIPNRIKHLLVWGSGYNESIALNISNDNRSITLGNRYPMVGDNIQMSLLDKKYRYLKPNAITVNTIDNLDNDEILSHQLSKPLTNLRNVKLELNNEELYANLLKGELLDEVIVNSKKKKDKRYWMESSFGNSEKVDVEMAERFPLFTDYLNSKGYFMINTPGQGRQIGNNPVATDNLRVPTIYLNGLPMLDTSILFDTRTSDYEEIYFDRSGPNGAPGEGIISLRWRKSPLYKGEFKESYPFTELKFDKGFEPVKQFYMPEYKFFNTKAFQQVGTIAWFSDVKVQANESINFKVLDTGLDKFTLYIEGIAEDGSLINIKKSVDLSNEIN